ncbi:DUF4238 domain-containing protein [Roseateles sp. DAIF2]|uniref:DUF4238 domain-containing protein n=1 Tax=Roseateles sp. DAIF2 TaxID=2714952 RepID=UPI0018A28864|nr:DUF4238 domain-containing protein [Roseateles sp. DAIF2]QPF75973.1 DUF4238 domain-containing protein [Roseateles sp. DAIF2]
MSTQAEHHYIPKFLLRGWEGGADEKLSAMRWLRGQISEHRYKAKSVAKERHLYAIRRDLPEPNQRLEQEFMTKHVDEPASLVHKAIVANGMANLTEREQYIWTRFLVSLVMRGPGAIAYVRAKGINALGEQFDVSPDDYLDQRGAEPEPTLRKYIEKHAPEVLTDFGNVALPNIIQTSFLNKKIFEAQWITRRLTKGPQRFVIGDRPLTLFGAIADRFLLFVPVAPDLGFFAFNSHETGARLREKGEPTLIREMNRGMVEQASVYVYGTNNEHRRLLELRLEKTAAGPGLGLGPRPPAQA